LTAGTPDIQRKEEIKRKGKRKKESSVQSTPVLINFSSSSLRGSKRKRRKEKGKRGKKI